MQQHTLQQHGEQLQIVGLVPGFTGSTNLGVLLFANAPTVLGSQALAEFATVVNSATAGTSIEILRRGLYHFALGVRSTTAGASIFAGLSLDATTFIGVPAMGANGMQGVDAVNNAAVDVGQAMVCGYVRITQALAQTPGQGIIRGHASSGGGAAPTNVDAAASFLRLTRVADLNDLS